MVHEDTMDRTRSGRSEKLAAYEPNVSVLVLCAEINEWKWSGVISAFFMQMQLAFISCVLSGVINV